VSAGKRVQLNARVAQHLQVERSRQRPRLTGQTAVRSNSSAYEPGIEEGRNTIQGLRSSDSRTLDLVLALSSVQQELAVQPDMDFRVTVAGRHQPLRPPIRKEIYRIGREALLNAFCHSGAKSFEFELEYTENDLRMCIRDNGCGIDPQMLHASREGHWGLPGHAGAGDENQRATQNLQQRRGGNGDPVVNRLGGVGPDSPRLPLPWPTSSSVRRSRRVALLTDPNVRSSSHHSRGSIPSDSSRLIATKTVVTPTPLIRREVLGCDFQHPLQGLDVEGVRSWKLIRTHSKTECANSSRFSSRVSIARTWRMRACFPVPPPTSPRSTFRTSSRTRSRYVRRSPWY
jgi:hypothetical protein